jgi:hypothetical protein
MRVVDYGEKRSNMGVVDISEKMKEAKLIMIWYGHVIRRDKGELVRDMKIGTICKDYAKEELNVEELRVIITGDRKG